MGKPRKIHAINFSFVGIPSHESNKETYFVHKPITICVLLHTFLKLSGKRKTYYYLEMWKRKHGSFVSEARKAELVSLNGWPGA